MQKITLTISSDIALQLQHLASEQKVTVEVIATDLLNQAMQGKKPEAFRIVQSERIGQPVFSDSEGLREIIHRQDEEIIWLRDQITRLSTLTPTTHVIKHEYPAFNAALHDNPEKPSCDEKKILKPGNKKSETTAESYPMVPHPSIWIPQYESLLLSTDIVEDAEIDAISGATTAGTMINKMVNAALEAAKTGDTSEQVIID